MSRMGAPTALRNQNLALADGTLARPSFRWQKEPGSGLARLASGYTATIINGFRALEVGANDTMVRSNSPGAGHVAPLAFARANATTVDGQETAIDGYEVAARVARLSMYRQSSTKYGWRLYGSTGGVLSGTPDLSVNADGVVTARAGLAGTSLNVGAGNVIGGAIVGTSLNASGGNITGGAITGTSLNVGAGAITGASLNVGAGAIAGGAITGTSLNVGAGAITGGAITGTSLNVGAGAIAGNSLALVNGGTVGYDLTVSRGGAGQATVGYIFYGNSGSRYIGWSGASFSVNGALDVNGSITGTSYGGGSLVAGSPSLLGLSVGANGIGSAGRITTDVGVSAGPVSPAGIGEIRNSSRICSNGKIYPNYGPVAGGLYGNNTSSSLQTICLTTTVVGSGGSIIHVGPKRGFLFAVDESSGNTTMIGLYYNNQPTVLAGIGLTSRPAYDSTIGLQIYYDPGSSGYVVVKGTAGNGLISIYFWGQTVGESV